MCCGGNQYPTDGRAGGARERHNDCSKAKGAWAQCGSGGHNGSQEQTHKAQVYAVSAALGAASASDSDHREQNTSNLPVDPRSTMMISGTMVLMIKLVW